MEEQSEYFLSSRENTRTSRPCTVRGTHEPKKRTKEKKLEEKFGEWGYFLEKGFTFISYGRKKVLHHSKDRMARSLRKFI